MNKTIILAAGPFLVLAACSNEPTVNERNASVEEVADKVREATKDGQFIRAGEWKSTSTIEEMTVPGMSSEEAARIRSSMKQAGMNEFTTCLTEEDVKQPKGKFFTGNDECRYDHFTMKGGKIDAAMRCETPGGGSQVMTMKGNYSPERYDMRMEMRPDSGGSGEGMNMRMHIESRRVGECTPKTNDAP